MSKKKRMFRQHKHQREQSAYSVLIVLFAVLFLSAAYSVWGVDEECDIYLSYDSVANRLCVPAIPLAEEYNIDGYKTDWTPGNYYPFYEYDGYGVRAFVSHKKREFDKADLYLFFELEGFDAVGTFNDEIRIGLNPGTSPTNNILIKYYPWGSSASSPVPDLKVYTYNGSNWISASTGTWLTGNIVKQENNSTASWSVEMKIPLETAPIPITGTDFRLYLELISDDGTTPSSYSWPPHYITGEHNYICVNPTRWHPMSFGSGCYADLDIANGVYSCDAIYILRGSVKSTEIYVDQDNEFHADVHNGSSMNATGVKVYLTLLRLGLGTSPIAMNYDYTDDYIRKWFEQYGEFPMSANNQLGTGTPKPPSTFSVNAGTTNTDARFTWNPSDEDPATFGTIDDMVGAGSHNCTGAFVDFKDDPNMANNLSFCNTDIVYAPADEKLTLPFFLGPYFPYAHPKGAFHQRLKVTALNEPYPGWFNRAEFSIKGKGVKPIGRNVFNVSTPEKGEIGLEFELAIPSENKPGDDRYKNEKYTGRGFNLPSPGEGPVAGNEMADRDKRLKKIYGDRPIVLIQGYAPAGYKTGANQEHVQLYRVTSYAAFALDLQKSPVVSFKPYELTLFAGWTWWKDTLGLDDGPVIGAKLGYKWPWGMTLELEAGLGFTEVNILQDKGNWLQLFGNLRYEIPVAGRLKPFVTAGAGIVMFKGFLHNDNTFAYQWGGGLIYEVTPTFGIRMDGRFLRLTKALFGAASGTNNFQLCAGLVFWF